MLNFTRAAEKCNVSQPALTRGIQALETELGGTLFRRERGATHLTELGRLLRPRLETIYQQSEAALSTARSFLRLDDAPLRLGVLCTVGPLCFMNFINHFHQQHPGIKLTITEGTAMRLREELLSGALDVALMAQPQPFEPSFEARPLYRESFVVAFPPGHPFEQTGAVRTRDVKGESYLSRTNCEYRDYFHRLCSEYDMDVIETHRSDRDDWIQAMVIAGLGICFIPEYSLKLPGLSIRKLIDPGVERTVALVTVVSRQLAAPVEALVRAVKSFSWS